MKFTPYSFSKIQVYKQCPNKFNLSYIQKIKYYNESLALEKGSFLHQQIEDYFNDEITLFNFKLHNTSQIQELNTLSSGIIESSKIKTITKYKNNPRFKIYIEDSLGFELQNKQLKVINYKKSSVMFKGFIDFYMLDSKTNTGIIIDWKSGKVPQKQYTNNTQLKLYGLYIFLKYPNINNIKIQFYYLEHDFTKEWILTRNCSNDIQDKLLNDINEIETDVTFNKKYSPLCRYCDYFQRECEFNDSELMQVI